MSIIPENITPVATLSHAKILVVALQGLGNTLFLVPMLEMLKRAHPDSEIHLLLKNKISKIVLDNDGIIAGYHYTGELKLSGATRLLKILLVLRWLRFDISVTAFPANHSFFNIVSFLIGAKKRIAHLYRKHNGRTLGFLNTHRVPIVDRHDYEQNLNLLTALGISIDSGWSPHLWGWSVKPVRGIRTVGIHPGSSRQRAMKEKRWAWQNFTELVLRFISERPNLGFWIFFGPDEADMMELFRPLEASGVRLIAGKDLKETINLIAETDLFISNDSGLMNIASALGKRVLTIAGGPTDPVRTRPWGKNNAVVFSDIHCYPCRGLFNLGERFMCVYPTRRCLEDISVERVYRLAETMLEDKGKGDCGQKQLRDDRGW